MSLLCRKEIKTSQHVPQNSRTLTSTRPAKTRKCCKNTEIVFSFVRASPQSIFTFHLLSKPLIRGSTFWDYRQHNEAASGEAGGRSWVKQRWCCSGSESCWASSGSESGNRDERGVVQNRVATNYNSCGGRSWAKQRLRCSGSESWGVKLQTATKEGSERHRDERAVVQNREASN